MNTHVTDTQHTEPVTGVLVVAHSDLASALLAAAEHVLQTPTRPTRVIGANTNERLETLTNRISEALKALDGGAGVLVLVDVPGATPFNAAHRAIEGAKQTLIVTGVNLPMLIRVYNYPDLALAELAESAIEAGQRAIAITI